jgi:hypothetical protein
MSAGRSMLLIAQPLDDPDRAVAQLATQAVDAAVFPLCGHRDNPVVDHLLARGVPLVGSGAPIHPQRRARPHRRVRRDAPHDPARARPRPRTGRAPEHDAAGPLPHRRGHRCRGRHRHLPGCRGSTRRVPLARGALGSRGAGLRAHRGGGRGGCPPPARRPRGAAPDGDRRPGRPAGGRCRARRGVDGPAGRPRTSRSPASTASTCRGWGTCSRPSTSPVPRRAAGWDDWCDWRSRAARWPTRPTR